MADDKNPNDGRTIVLTLFAIFGLAGVGVVLAGLNESVQGHIAGLFVALAMSVLPLVAIATIVYLLFVIIRAEWRLQHRRNQLRRHRAADNQITG